MMERERPSIPRPLMLNRSAAEIVANVTIPLLRMFGSIILT